MRRIIFALSLLPTLASADPAPVVVQPQGQIPSPTPDDIVSAGAATSGDFANLVIRLRAQVAADQREIAYLKQAIDAAKKETPPPAQGKSP